MAEQSPIKAEQVLHLLDTEIDRIISEEKKPGWNQWALYGAIATLIWLFLEEFDSGKVDVLLVLILFLTLSLVIDALRELSLLFSSSNQNQEPSSRFLLSTVLAGSRYQLFWKLIRCILLIFLAQKSSYMVAKFIPYLVYIYYGLFSVAYLLGIIVSYIKLPLPISLAQRRILSLLPPLFFSSLLLVSINAYLSSEVLIDQLTVSTLKTGFILLALSYLAILLTEKVAHNIFLYPLISIRRNLALGQIRVVDAILHADIALKGMRINDVLQEDVSRILLIIEKANVEAEKINNKMEELISKLPENWCLMSEEQRSRIEVDVKAWSAIYIELGEIMEKSVTLSAKLRDKIKFLVSLSKSYPSELDEIVKTITVAIDDSRQKLIEYVKTTNELSKRIDIPCKPTKGLS